MTLTEAKTLWAKNIARARGCKKIGYKKLSE